jgi:hypothetical protein
MNAVPSPALDLGDAVSRLILDHVGRTFDRDVCDSVSCPHEPAWSRDLSAVTDRLLAEGDRRTTEVLDRLCAWLTEATDAFAAEHPEAPRR